MSVIKLSHTAKEKYLSSPRSYYYHYHLYLREKTLGSPLFFGSLIETGLNVLFAGGTLEQALEAFRKAFRYYTINGSSVDLSNSVWVRYSKADYDVNVFTESEIRQLDGKSLKFKSWASLQKKGEMLIEAYHRDIFPHIKEVLAVQKYFSIPNGAGDEIIGFVDLICEMDDGRVVIPDHKTSSQSLKQVVQNESYQKQFHLYYEAFKDQYPVDAIGPIILEKKIRTNEPRARVSYQFDKPSEEIIEKTIVEFDDTLYDIKQGKFPCASPNCDAYGQSCCYKRYCKSGGADLTGLTKVGKDKK